MKNHYHSRSSAIVFALSCLCLGTGLLREAVAQSSNVTVPGMANPWLAKGTSASAALARRGHSLQAQTPLSWAQSYGVGSYGGDFRPVDDPFYGSGTDVPTAIAEMPDGGMVVAGQIDFPKYCAPFVGNPGTSGRANAVLVRYGVDGTVLWQHELHQNNDRLQYFNGNGYYYAAPTRVSQIVVDAAGNIFVAGGKGNPDNGGSLPFVAKFSSAGDLLWQNGIGTAVDHVPGNPPADFTVGVAGAYYMSLTNDGGVVISLAQGKPNFASGVIPVLAKYNANGSLALYRAYENPPQIYGDSPVAQSRDGSRYAMAFWTYLPDGSGGSVFGTLLLVLDASGNILAQNGWISPDGGGEQPVALISTSDGGFASLSYVADYAGGVIRKYNADLSATIFEKRIKGASPRHLWLNSLAETPDGGFLIGGETAGPDFSTSQYDGLLMKVSATGALLFSSLIGGPRSEGGPASNGPSTSFAIALANGGYGFAATTTSYTTDGPLNGGFSFKSDWWSVRTDANRHVRNFTGVMLDQSLSVYSVTGSPQAPLLVSAFTEPNYSYGPVATTLPNFQVLDVGDFLPPNSPTIQIQGSSPRIVSAPAAKATVEQHFTYQIATAYFPAAATITYSAAGLPSGFAINSTTGVISGAPQAGSETTVPIPITLQATDGTDPAQLVLSLTIADGIPAFKVNGSDQPAYPNPSGTAPTNLADTTLSFTSSQPGALAGRVLRVQASTDPTDPSTWHALANGTEGFMIYDSISRKYLLGTSEYPHAAAVYFRTQTRAPGKPDAYSNVVGPLDLSSTAARLGTTKLYISRNGRVSNIRFGVTVESAPVGLSVKMQATKTPAVDGSWTDVANGTLAQDGAHPNEFYLGLDEYPAGAGNYFRAAAAAPGFVKSVSGPQGPFTFIFDPAATVTLTVPHNGSNDGTDFDDPIVVSSASFNLSTMAQSTRALRQLSLDYDGDVIENFGGAGQGTSLYTSNVVGDHLVEAVAVDDLGIAGHARPVHVRVAPASPGKIRYLVTAGSWTDPAIWIDSNGSPGVPGPEDLAVLGQVDVTLPQAVTIRAVSMNGGAMSGAGKLTITGFFTIGGGRIANNIDILSGATMLMLNDLDVGLGGRVNNFGRLKIHGKGGIGSYTAMTGKAGENPDLINPFPAIVNWFKTTFLPPAGGRGGNHPTPTPAPSPTPAPEVRKVQVSILQNAGTIKLIGNDGAGLITNDGGSLIGNDGGGLFDKNGNRIVASGGGNIVASGGGNIVSTGGGNIVATGGGNIVASGGGNIVATGGGNGPQNKVAAEQLEALATAPTLIQTAGETDLSGITILGGVSVDGGTLDGSGAIIGDLANSGGLIVPGSGAPGSFGVTGTFAQSGGGSLQVETAGGDPAQFDQVQAGGGATLGGNLFLHTQNGYLPLANDSFNPVGYSNVSGAFNSVSSNVQIAPLSTGLSSVLTPGAPNPFTLLNVVSRKTHGTAGIYDLPLSLGQTIGVECRSSGGEHTLVFTFNNQVVSGNASVASGTGQIAGVPIFSGRTMTVSLTGVSNAQRVAVMLSGVTDPAAQVFPDTAVTIGFLVGDTNGNGTVNASDIAQTKGQSGAAVTSANFRTDINVSGTLTASDIGQIKANAGHTLP